MYELPVGLTYVVLCYMASLTTENFFLL